MAFREIIEGSTNFFQGLKISFGAYGPLIGLTLYTIFIVLYCLFVWKFYKFISKRDLIVLNLKQYNYSSNPGLSKFLAIAFDIIEYIFILPFIVLFWFVILAIFLLLLSKIDGVGQILMITAAIITAIRITSYASEELAKDIAKIFPFTMLAMFLLDPNFFDFAISFGKILEIPSLLSNVVIFFVFIFVMEFVLRIFLLLSELIRSNKEI